MCLKLLKSGHQSDYRSFQASRCRGFLASAGLVVIAVLFMHSPNALADSVRDYLSPDITNVTVTELMRLNKALECSGKDRGAQSCLFSLPISPTTPPGRDQQAEGMIYLNSLDDRVGQIIVNGSTSSLVQVLDSLYLYYGKPISASAETWELNVACSAMSEWRRNEVSVIMKVCRAPGSGKDDGFIINIVADWYALASNHLH